MNKLDKPVRSAAPHPGSAQNASRPNGLGEALSRLVRLFGIDEDTPPEELRIPTEDQAPIAEPAPKAKTRDVDGRDASSHLLSAFDALHTPVVVVNHRLSVVHANEEARHIFGDKIRGRSFAMFYRDPAVINEITETIADGQPRQIDVRMDVPLKRQYRLRITRVAPRPLQPVQTVLEFQESTLIHRSESMRSEFVANVSHELRSPLATLIGFIETLKDDGEDALARDRFLGIMEGEAQRMRRLIDDLLSLTNVELHEHERPRNRVDLVAVLQEVIASLASRARKRELDIRLKHADDLPATMGDHDQLVQVFHNLITNAIKYGADGERVDVCIARHANGLPDEGPTLEVSVRDYGQGIEAEHLPRLTERFYRVDKGRSRAMGGTGLGLAIVKHIISRHRGRFQVESERGQGSLFKVRLPVYRQSPDALEGEDLPATNL